ncbi:MAG: competence protein ComK [Acholeplasmataceae bacterium]
MVEYIENNAYGAVIVENGKPIQTKRTNLAVIRDMCLDRLFSYEGYVKAVRKKIGICYRIPVYLDDENAFFPTRRTRDFANIWVNAEAIKGITEHGSGILILFRSGSKKELRISRSRVMRAITVLQEIRKAKVKHFHDH